MSLVYIHRHGENIRDIENRFRPVKEHQPLKYTSIFKDRVRDLYHKQHIVKQDNGTQLLYDANRESCKTMGRAREPTADPHHFLRKREGVKFQKVIDHMGCVGGKKPSLPRTAPLQRPQHCTNFVQRNIQKVKSAPPAVHPPRYVDSADGNTRLLLPSGLMPLHTFKRNYGKVPSYLGAHKKEKLQLMDNNRRQEARFANLCRSYVQDGVRKLTSEERMQILAGLKTNLDQLTKVYMKLPLYTDTIAKQQRKSSLENSLRQLEQYIGLIEGHKEIYVSEY